MDTAIVSELAHFYTRYFIKRMKELDATLGRYQDQAFGRLIRDTIARDQTWFLKKINDCFSD